MDNLPELRDIHLPTDGVSFWPLADGWWLILGAILLTLVAVKLIMWLRKSSKRLYARYLLNQTINENGAVASVKMSEILRRICVSRYPQAVALSGQEWIDFVNAHSADKLDGELAQLLVNAPYIQADNPIFSADNVAKLRVFCQNWIGANL